MKNKIDIESAGYDKSDGYEVLPRVIRSHEEGGSRGVYSGGFLEPDEDYSCFFMEDDIVQSSQEID